MPIRMLRDWTTSEKIDRLTEIAEIFFVRLIMKADDHGCFHAHPKLLKAALFPLKNYSEKIVESCLNELATQEVITVYESEGRKYLKINDFGQRLRNMVSKFPQPDDNSRTIVSKQPPELEYEENTNKKEKPNTNGEEAATKVATIDDRKKILMDKIAKYIGTYEKEMLREFFDYWTEMNEGGKKMRFEMEKVFELKRRLKTWFNRSKLKFNGKGKKTHTDNARDLAIDFIQRRGTTPQG